MSQQEASILETLYRSSDGTNRFKKFSDGTPDPTKYHDISSVNFIGSNGASISNFLPGNHGFAGWRGVVVPRSRPEGGSLGFDCHAPQKCFIDPELTNGRIAVDFALLHKDKISEAFAQASVEAPSDISDRAVYTYLHMAEASKQASAAKLAPPAADRVLVSRPVGAFGASPKPPAPPSQELSEAPPVRPSESQPRPEVQQPARVPERAPPLSIVSDVRSPVPARKQSMEHNKQAPRPLRKVLVELPKPFGTFTAYYHDVIRTDDLLIFVYDHRESNLQQVWFPPAPDLSPDEEGNVPEPSQLGVLVYDKEGQADTGFIVYPTGARFAYEGLEYCLLSIYKEKSYKETPSHVPQQPSF